MSDKTHASSSVRWARFRFQVVGPLFVEPPEPGALVQALDALAARTYEHPTKSGVRIQFSRSTIERWFYAARNATGDPVGKLARKVHAHAGTHPAMPATVEEALTKQHQAHPSWTYQLHYDNLVALAKKQPELGAVPSVATVRRFMKRRGLLKVRKPRRRRGEPVQEPVFEARERRSFEVGHVHALWHADFHVGSRRVVEPDGTYSQVVLLGFLDDASRIACHLQWYREESAEAFVHGLQQALQKRGMPRALLTDNGQSMQAHEVEEGLERLGIVHPTTLPYCPEQNGKQESFWGRVEGRLMPMLEGKRELTLAFLNQATQAWVELEYHREVHSELGMTPLERMLQGPSANRPSWSSDKLRRAFRMEVQRTQRRSDGTITVAGVRFEIPSRYRVLLRPVVRYARWDLSTVDLVDERHGTHLATLLPLDKTANASGARRVVEPVSPPGVVDDAYVGVAPLLDALMEDYAATGLPPAYVPLAQLTDEPKPTNATPGDHDES